MQKVFTHLDHEQFGDIRAETTQNGREYSTPGGVFPSVTTVTGWKKQKFFAEWRKNNPTESRRVLSRGNVLHEGIEDYLNNKTPKSMDENCTDLFNAMKPHLENIDNIHAQEVPLWSSTLKLAGRVDCVAEYNGVLSIIDFKGSTRAKNEKDIANYYQQATAYAIMWQEMTGQPIEQIVILISSEDGITQEFVKDPKCYVKSLKCCIDDYYAKNTENQFSM